MAASYLPAQFLGFRASGSWHMPYTQLSYSLNSLKGGYIGSTKGTTIEVIKGDTRSLEYGSVRVTSKHTKKAN